MPPLRKVQREDIIGVTLEILKNEDMENVNARRIAKELNCSVQPIYHNFENMEELKKIAFQKIFEKYQEYMIEGSKTAISYKGMGLSYIKFARDYPNYFKFLFMSKAELTSENFITNDDFGNNIIEKGMELTGFSYEEQKKFHVKVWVFTHGIATLVATNTVKFTEREIDQLLQESVREMIIGKIERGKNGKYN